MRITFIGGGAMGGAMLSAILDRKVSTPGEITVCDVSAERCRHLSRKFGVAADSGHAGVPGSEIVVLAIKPKDLTGVMSGLRGKLRPEQLVVSIVAGARLSTMSAGLDHGCMVRVMPNTPAQIGEGVSVWTATSAVTERQKEQARTLLGTMGTEIFVDDEKYLDMVTAVSGSGPAYVFYFIEALTEAAVDIGLPRNMAEKTVLETVLGSGHLLQRSGKTPQELRTMVTSPGGTTAEAVRVFEERGFFTTVREAVRAAYEKARKLGG